MEPVCQESKCCSQNVDIDSWLARYLALVASFRLPAHCSLNRITPFTADGQQNVDSLTPDMCEGVQVVTDTPVVGCGVVGGKEE